MERLPPDLSWWLSGVRIWVKKCGELGEQSAFTLAAMSMAIIGRNLFNPQWASSQISAR